MVGRMRRLVEDEILDGLAPDDPEAVRSRADLRRINFLMGNERWILSQVARHREWAAEGIVEMGAGNGGLLGRLAGYGPATGVDLVPRPRGLAAGVGWWQGDILGANLSGGIVVANLFLHHFEGEPLARIGELISKFRLLISVEPLRTTGSLRLAGMMNPWVGPVTRHDMAASIRAGFVPGEMGAALGLDDWEIEESPSWRGGLRVLGRRPG